MRWKQIEDEPKVFALIFETGDEIAGVLKQFSKNQGLGGSSFKAIGAPCDSGSSEVELLLGNLPKKLDPESGMALIQRKCQSKHTVVRLNPQAT